MTDSDLTRRRFLEGLGTAAAVGLAGCSGNSGSDTPTESGVDTTTRATTSQATPTRTTTEETTTYAPDTDPDDDGLTKEIEERYGLPVEGGGEPESFSAILNYLDENDRDLAHEYVDTLWGEEGLNEYEAGGLNAVTHFDTVYWDNVVGHIVENDGIEEEDMRYLGSVVRLQESDYINEDGLLDDFEKRFLDRNDNRGLEKAGDMYLPTVEYLGLDPENPDDRIESIRNQLFEGQGLNDKRMEYLNRVSDSIDECHSPVSQLEELGKLGEFSQDGEITDEELRMVANEDGDQLIRIKEERVGTDPREADSDDDGLQDGWEVYGVVNNSDINEKDVFIEVDYEQGIQEEKLQQKLHEIATYLEQNVPTNNGDQAIDIHWQIDESFPSQPENISEERAEQIMKERFDKGGEGYFWFSVLDEDTTVDDVMGTAALEDGDRQGAISMNYRSNILHELVHILGVNSGTFDHVDSYEVPFEEKPTVMNFNWTQEGNTENWKTYMHLVPEEFQEISEDSLYPDTSELEGAFEENCGEEEEETPDGSVSPDVSASGRMTKQLG